MFKLRALGAAVGILSVLILPGCQQSGGLKGGGRSAATISPASPQGAGGSEKLAYLTVTSLRLAPESVEPGRPFSARVLIKNEGETESRPFEVEAQANLITQDAVKSYPIGGKEVLTLKPHQAALLTMTRKQGLDQPGVYTVTVSLHRANLELPGSTDRFNPKVPEKSITVRTY